MLALIDSHSHFDDARFDADRDAAYQRAHTAGVKAQVLAAVSARLWPQLKTVAVRYPGLYPSYGLHPAWLAAVSYTHLDVYKRQKHHLEQAVHLAKSRLFHGPPARYLRTPAGFSSVVRRH